MSTKNLESKIIYQNKNSAFYFCNCCDGFFLKYHNMAWKISPKKFHEFHKLVNSIVEAYAEGLNPSTAKNKYNNDIRQLLSLNEIQLYEICEILDSSFIEIKRITLEINFTESKTF